VRTSLAAGAQGVVIRNAAPPGLRMLLRARRLERGAPSGCACQDLSRAMEEMKEAGYWLVGLDERAEKRHTEVDFKVPVGVVLGGEGKGCMHWSGALRFSGFDSHDGPRARLNVSVAAGVVLFEAVRQRERQIMPTISLQEE